MSYHWPLCWSGLKSIVKRVKVWFFVKTRQKEFTLLSNLHEYYFYTSKKQPLRCLPLNSKITMWNVTLMWPLRKENGMTISSPWIGLLQKYQQLIPKKNIPPLLSSSFVYANKIKVNKSWHRRWALLNKLFIHLAAAFSFDLTQGTQCAACEL